MCIRDSLWYMIFSFVLSSWMVAGTIGKSRSVFGYDPKDFKIPHQVLIVYHKFGKK